jgi:hypothetical protein
MSKLNPEKLSVEFREGITTTEPIIPRRYTLTHSDITTELFLTIGLTYAYDKINAMRDEVLGGWIKIGDQYFFYVYLYIDGQFGLGVTDIRNYIFRRELPLALEAIRYGDKKFFSAHPELNDAPIVVHFMSTNPQYNRIESWGTFLHYYISSSHKSPMVNPFRQNRYLLDMKIGDVTGDAIPDKVFLYGSKPEGATGVFTDNIIVVIEDGRTNETKTITPAFNSGYNPRLFLGDFTKDNIDDIKISIDSGGSGGYGYFYLYSFKNNNLQEIFNFDKYNEEYKYKVDYADLYKVDVGNVMLNKLFILDVSHKGYDYVSQYYDEKGKLKKPVQGEVLALGALVPIVNDEKTNAYDLLAFQRIIGTTNSDTLGYIENLLSWDGQKFVSSRMFASIPGTNLSSLY